jgi:hypothetical protein
MERGGVRFSEVLEVEERYVGLKSSISETFIVTFVCPVFYTTRYRSLRLAGPFAKIEPGCAVQTNQQ